MAHRATIKSRNGVRRVDRSLVHPALLAFLFSAGRFMSKQREANRQIVETLEGIESTLRRIDNT